VGGFLPTYPTTWRDEIDTYRTAYLPTCLPLRKAKASCLARWVHQLRAYLPNCRGGGWDLPFLHTCLAEKAKLATYLTSWRGGQEGGGSIANCLATGLGRGGTSLASWLAKLGGYCLPA